MQALKEIVELIYVLVVRRKELTPTSDLYDTKHSPYLAAYIRNEKYIKVHCVRRSSYHASGLAFVENRRLRKCRLSHFRYTFSGILFGSWPSGVFKL
jgi:hypothetical protein